MRLSRARGRWRDAAASASGEMRIVSENTTAWAGAAVTQAARGASVGEARRGDGGLEQSRGAVGERAAEAAS